MAEPLSATIPVARSEPRTRTALWLEAIVLRQQIAVLERAQPGAHASVALIDCFGFCCRAGGEVGAKAWWSFSLIRSCVGAVTAGPRFGDIDRVAAGEVDVPGFPVRSAN